MRVILLPECVLLSDSGAGRHPSRQCGYPWGGSFRDRRETGTGGLSGDSGN